MFSLQRESPELITHIHVHSGVLLDKCHAGSVMVESSFVRYIKRYNNKSNLTFYLQSNKLSKHVWNKVSFWKSMDPTSYQYMCAHAHMHVINSGRQGELLVIYLANGCCCHGVEGNSLYSWLVSLNCCARHHLLIPALLKSLHAALKRIWMKSH